MSRGVLLMAYGTAAGPDDVLRYYTHIRHGHPPTDAQLEDLQARYRAIGGVSPLSDITRQQAEGLQSELDRRQGPGAFEVVLGLKHAPPFIADGVRALAQHHITDAAALVLAPHYSAMSVGAYLEEAMDAAPRSVKFRAIRSWAAHPGLIDILRQRIVMSSQRFTVAERKNLPIIFSAHSLPQRILTTGDSYPAELKRTGDLTAAALHTDNYTFSWQSAGRTREPWMGPDILDKLTRMHRDGFSQALICPCGFVSDHLEVLYDLDIQAREHALAMGMHVERTPSLNADPHFIAVLADLVEGAWQ